MSKADALSAIQNLAEKKQQAYEKFAQEGAFYLIAHCLNHLPAQKSQQILKSYPPEIQNKLSDFCTFLNQNDQNPDRESPHSDVYDRFVLSQTDLITAQDYINLEEGLSDITLDEYKEIIHNYEDEDSDKWLLERIKQFHSKFLMFEKIEKFHQKMIVNELSLSELYSLFLYAPENIVQIIKNNMSKTNLADMEREFTFIQKPSEQVYLETKKKISSMIKDELVFYW